MSGENEPEEPTTMEFVEESRADITFSTNSKGLTQPVIRLKYDTAQALHENAFEDAKKAVEVARKLEKENYMKLATVETVTSVEAKIDYNKALARKGVNPEEQS